MADIAASTLLLIRKKIGIEIIKKGIPTILIVDTNRRLISQYVFTAGLKVALSIILSDITISLFKPLFQELTGKP
jgi:hypothetical protein